MRSNAVTCNVCGHAKQEANHWLCALSQGRSGIVFWPASEPVAFDGFDHLPVEDICGADCAHKRLSQWLTEQGI